MTPERWSRIKAIFDAVVDLDPEERSAFLDRECGDDSSLRQDVERLLASDAETGRPGQVVPRPLIDGVLLKSLTTPLEPALSPGQILASRFRIIRLVARGGMGEVYEAADLGEEGEENSVALKTIRPEIASNEEMVARFKREVRLAKRITHPNVCRIHDLHQHDPARGDVGGPATPILFLSMQFLKGETLSHRLSRRGPIPKDEALPLIAEMASALDAAHRKGIAHRDFKCANTMLVEDELGAVHAMVTDFGLASPIRHATSRADELLSGENPMGTLAYMAPEQLAGEPATPATDIYALGIVIHEMITGQKPFSSEPLPKAVPGLPISVPSPQVHLPKEAASWETTILKCLEHEPSNRFASVTDVVKSLEAQHSKDLPQAAPVEGKSNGFFAAGALLLALLGGYWGLQRHDASHHRLFAVLGFKDASGGASVNLSGVFTTSLVALLRSTDDVEVVPEQEMAQLKMDLNLPERESYARETLRKIRTNTGADLVLVGSYLRQGSASDRRVHLSLLAQNTSSGETAASVTVDGPEDAIVDLISRAMAGLRAQMHLQAATKESEQMTQSALPKSPEALRAYSDALYAMYAFDLSSARDLFQKAIAVEPDYAPAHAELAEAYDYLGFEKEARAEIEEALKLSKTLPPEDRVVIEGHYYDIHHQWSKAVESYRALLKFYPESVAYGLMLASVQSAPEQMKTVMDLRKLPAPLRDDPRIDIRESRTAGQLSDFRRQRDVAQRAVAKARARQARGQLAAALESEGDAERMMGHPDRAKALYLEAKQNYEAIHDEISVAACMRSLGGVLLDSGDLAESWNMNSDALAIGARIGSLVSQARALRTMGEIRYGEGKLSEAAQLFERSKTLWREVESPINVGAMDSLLGRVKFRQGHAAESLPVLEEALRTIEEHQNKRLQVETLSGLIDALVEAGDLKRAGAESDKMFAIQGKIENRVSQALVRRSGAKVDRERGQFDEARRKITDAIKDAEASGQKGNAGLTRSALALLDFDEGQFSSAESTARAAAAELDREGREPNAAVARAVEALAILAEGDAPRARDVLDPVMSGLGAMEDAFARNFVQVAHARVLAANGQRAAARSALETLRTDASRMGLVRMRLEAMLAMSELEGADAQLAEEAQRLGFLRIAQRARAVKAGVEKRRSAVRPGAGSPRKIVAGADFLPVAAGQRGSGPN